MLIMLFFWTMFTTGLLFVFLVSLLLKYANGLTMNEDFKLGDNMDFFNELIGEIKTDI